LGRNITPCPTTVMVRRDMFERVGGFEESFRDPWEDAAFYLKAALDAMILVHPDVWARWRNHGDSATTDSFRKGDFRAASRRFAEWARAYVLAREPENAETMLRALRRLEYSAALFERAYEQQRGATSSAADAG
jgi:GT2 family glycosyltransferase